MNRVDIYYLGILVNIFFNVGLTHIFSQEYNDSFGNKMIFAEYVLYLCLLFELHKLSCTLSFLSIFATTVRVRMIYNRASSTFFKHYSLH